MFRLLLKKELQEVLLTTKFATTFVACLVLTVIAFVGGAHNYKVMQAEYEAAKTENVRQMEGLTDWDQITHRVFLPPQPLAALVSGVSNDIGRTTQIRERGELRPEDSRFNEAPIHAVFRFLDLEFIITIVLSLFAIVFAYDSVNGEKERGTLRLAFTTPVPRDQFILSKLIGSIIALGIPFLVSILIGAALLPILGVPLTGGEWARLAVIVLVAYLYLGVFLGASVLVSSSTRRSSSSFLVILVVWIAAVMIVPRMSVLLVGRAVDVPSVDRLNFEKNQYRSQLWNDDGAAIMAWQQENPPRMGNRDSLQAWMDGFKEFVGAQADGRNEKMNEFNSRLNEERENRAAERQRLALGFAWISPTAVFSVVAGHVAGTSLELKTRYLEAAERYQAIYAAFHEEKSGNTGGIRIVHSYGDEELQEAIDPQELPAFDFRKQSLSEVGRFIMPGIGLLAVLNILFFAAAFVAFFRYDVR